MTRSHALSRRRLSLLPLAGLAVPSIARAQQWPDRPLRAVIPWPPGGQVDKYGRPLAEALAQALGRPVVVENRGGAGGLLGTEYVSRAPADGYTLLLNNNIGFIGNAAANPSVLRFDPIRDFAPIGIFHESAVVFLAHPSLGVRTFDEFLAAARASTQPLPYASSGGGSSGSLATQALQRKYGLEFLEVVYQGGGPRLTALLSGEVKFASTDIALVREYVTTGALRPLISVGRRRQNVWPDIPCFGDIGLTDFDYGNWQALLVPAGVPASIQARLRDALDQARRSPLFERASDDGEIIFQTGQEAVERIRRGYEERLRLPASPA
ncbi:Bug family tripartite tricarboxylate transporter substrate binding protein [Roseococcus pinisoli]|uniref:Tripartite tricarboxylate transporter substrate binding protein n=1 Tax=Roseococcus pinisoli TaxID=2835040 RepID=A0ABS5QJI5_9PROT|nr:tripartite tricarboxylate transporter substrate binding protein [Roseococcus pinisoli]MBS7813673.1 tripartite tricarboxylate transporter substrate binding protein [Roseococcus pinisoli]